MMVQVIVTAVTTSQDERPEPKVTNHLLEFASEDNYLDWLGEARRFTEDQHELTIK